MLSRQKTQSTADCNCCRLVHSDKSSRLTLPLARRGRPHLPFRSRRLLCKTCLNIKHQQQNDILQRQQQNFSHPVERTSSPRFEPITDSNKTLESTISHEIEFSLASEHEMSRLNNSEYESEQILMWELNTSENPEQSNSINDTGSLTDNEKKILLQEAVRKLQIVLSNRPTSTTIVPESDLDQIEFTYRALQTTVNILSSSLNSL